MVRLEGKLTIVLQSAHGLKGDDGTFAAIVCSVLQLGFVISCFVLCLGCEERGCLTSRDQRWRGRTRQGLTTPSRIGGVARASCWCPLCVWVSCGTAYAVVKLGRAGKTAKEVMKTDKVDSHNPVWNATDSVFCKGNYDELTILVKEKSLLTSDDHLGTAKIPTTTFAGGTFAGTLSLVDKELKPAGEIKAILSYEAGKVTVFDKLKRKLADSSDSD